MVPLARSLPKLVSARCRNRRPRVPQQRILVVEGEVIVAMDIARVPERPDLRVVYMSGYTDDAMLHNGVLEANVHFLEKPVATSKLVQMLRAALS